MPIQHASQSASPRRSACSTKLALRGNGCTTTRYLGSSSGGGGVFARFGILREGDGGNRSLGERDQGVQVEWVAFERRRTGVK